MGALINLRFFRLRERLSFNKHHPKTAFKPQSGLFTRNKYQIALVPYRRLIASNDAITAI
jgi:hypothetical protein